MNVGELIEELNKYPKTAHVVISNEIVLSTVCVPGRLKDGYYNKMFTQVDKGKDHGVMFLKHIELSTGEVVVSKI